MRDFFNSNAWHIGAEKDASDMDLCVKLLNRLINDDYLDNIFKHHDKKWGDLKVYFTPVKNNPKISELNIYRPNVKTEKDRKTEEIQRNTLYKLEGKQKKQDLELLTKLLNKHLFKWWD